MASVKIKSVLPIENEPLMAVTVELFENGSKECKKLVVPISFCRDNGIERGISDEDTYAALCDAAKLCAAVRRGESILAFAQNSKSALISKLIKRGFDPDIARRAADALCERGYIDDCECIDSEIYRCLRKNWGPKRIMNYLSQKGYCGAALEHAEEYLREVDFNFHCYALIGKKYSGALSDERAERDRAIAGLIRYGYSFSQVREAIREMSGKDCGDIED